MRFSYANGDVIDVPEMCGHCQLTTGGQHETGCPFHVPPGQIIESGFKIVPLPVEEEWE